MSSFRPFVHPFEGLRNGEVTYTTAIVTPNITHENRKKIEEKAQIMGYSLILFVGVIIASLLDLKLIATILFCMFVVSLCAYLIMATIAQKRLEAYRTIGQILWQSDRFTVATDEPETSTTILYESVINVQRQDGIPYQALAKSKNPPRDFTSVIVEFALNDQSTISAELLHTTNYKCTNPDQIIKIKPLTEQLLKFLFTNYTILDKRALEKAEL